MKNILTLFILFVSTLFLQETNPQISKQNTQGEIKLNLPLGSVHINYHFKKKWKNGDTLNNRSSTSIDDKIIFKLINYNDSLYKSLTFNKNKTKIIPVNYFESQKILFNKKDKILNKDENFYIDSLSYYCGTLFKDMNYHIELYKDKASYNSKIGGDLCVTNYFSLVCFNRQNEITDSLTILLNTNCITGPTERYFYIDKQLNIITKDFDFNEDGFIYYLENKKYKYDHNGKFLEIRQRI